MTYFLFIVAQVVALFLLKRAAPRRLAVHASRARMLPWTMPLQGHWFGAGFARDETGKRYDSRGKFIGAVAGPSMESYGMHEGQTFIAEPLDEAAKKRLADGDIVVVDAPAAGAKTGYRLRCIASIDSDIATFRPDAKGEHRPRPLEQVRALVEYVVD